MKRNCGFMLVELLMAVVILGILAGVAVPVAQGLGGWALRTSAQELAANIREARQTAIAGGVTCTITFFEFSGRYRLDFPGRTALVTLPGGVSYAANNFPLVSGRPVLSFRYTGAPSRGGHVALKDAQGKRLYIIVTPVTGRVRVDKNPP